MTRQVVQPSVHPQRGAPRRLPDARSTGHFQGDPGALPIAAAGGTPRLPGRAPAPGLYLSRVQGFKSKTCTLELVHAHNPICWLTLRHKSQVGGGGANLSCAAAPGLSRGTALPQVRKKKIWRCRTQTWWQ